MYSLQFVGVEALQDERDIESQPLHAGAAGEGSGWAHGADEPHWVI